MSKCDIRSQFDCQNGISNVYIRCLAQIRMSKYDFEFQNAIFGPNSNVKIGFRMSKYDITETSPYKSDTRFPSNMYLKWGKSGVGIKMIKQIISFNISP